MLLDLRIFHDVGIVLRENSLWIQYGNGRFGPKEADKRPEKSRSIIGRRQPTLKGVIIFSDLGIRIIRKRWFGYYDSPCAFVFIDTAPCQACHCEWRGPLREWSVLLKHGFLILRCI